MRAICWFNLAICVGFTFLVMSPPVRVQYIRNKYIQKLTNNTFEKALDAAHFLDDGCEFRVLRNKFLDFALSHSTSSGHSRHATRLFAKQFGTVLVVQLAVVHAVHDCHQLFQSSHRLLLATFSHEILAESRNHSLQYIFM